MRAPTLMGVWLKTGPGNIGIRSRREKRKIR
jgi:hypothetical protein